MGTHPELADEGAWVSAHALALAAVYAGASLATFLAFAWDKHCARRGRRRVPERTLGGWPGALAGQSLLHHKSEKLSYRLVLWAIVALHLAGWAAFAYLSWRGRN
jgi:uncharacterized membrane protein YsdA (DUF1294 family)